MKNYSVWDGKFTGEKNGRLDIIEKRISELEDIATETIQNEIHREKKMNKASVSFGTICLWPNICVIVYIEGDEWERTENFIWRNNDWKIPKLDEKVNPHIQEVQWVISIRNIKKTIPKRVTNFSKLVIKKKYLEQPDGKRYIVYRETNVRMTADSHSSQCIKTM